MPDEFEFNENDWQAEAERLDEEAKSLEQEREKSGTTQESGADVPEDAPIKERTPSSLKGLVEAVLFITSRPVQIMEISEIIGADDFDVEEALMELMNDYAFRGDSALEIDDSDGYILQIKQDFKTVLDTMMPMELSAGALRTLSAIAIKAPVLQSDLVELRGSAVYDHIPELLAKKLITKNRSGRSYRLNVTKSFHEYFKLRGDKKELEVMVGLLGAEIPSPGSVAAPSYEDLTGDVEEGESEAGIMAAPEEDIAS